MVKIILRNDKAKIVCSARDLITLRSQKEFRIKVKGAWFASSYRNRSWDGYANYITEAGYFMVGLFPAIIKKLNELDFEYEVEDVRETLRPGKVRTDFGKLQLRGYQKDAVFSIVTNRVDGIPFQRGVLNEATNAGKTLIAASLFHTYPDYAKLIFIVNREHLYKQVKKELVQDKLVDPREIGYIGKDGVKAGRFMVCMAQTLAKNIHKFKHLLEEGDICLVDECHYGSSPTYKYILGHLENCSVRVGMSGSPFKHKDKNKNMRILSFFGPETHITTNKDLIDQGFSTPPIVTILEGNTQVRINGDYKEEETQGLIKSKERNGRVLKRTRHHIKKGRYPLLLIAKYHNHTELLYKKVKKAFPDLKVNYIHVKVKDRLKRLEDFRAGKIDILVSSKLIKEGQNLPLIRAMVLACGGDSLIDIIQLVGRGLRKHKSKKVVYIDDFYDLGFYLQRHSKHRVKELKAQKFKVIEKYGKKRKEAQKKKAKQSR